MTRRPCCRPRCAVCGLHLHLCLCAAAPVLRNRIHIILLMHHRERNRPSNTARLAARCLASCELIIYGDRQQPGKLPDLSRYARPALLFPAPDAVPLDRWPGPPPDCLIIPDGTWPQAARMRRRLAGLRALPCACLPATDTRVRRLRHATRAERLGTMEAVALALGLLAETRLSEQLLEVLAWKVDRTLWMQGRLDRADVTGGIPDGIIRHFASPRAGNTITRS